LHAERDAGRFPINGPVEIRITDVDGTDGLCAKGLAPLAASAPDNINTAFDTVVWLDATTVPGTPGAGNFFGGLEKDLAALARAHKDKLRLRPEWSKGWAYDSNGVAWKDAEQLRQLQASIQSLGGVRETLDRCDKAGVFRNGLLDDLFGEKTAVTAGHCPYEPEAPVARNDVPCLTDPPRR
jgi:hypothetical protein